MSQNSNEKNDFSGMTWAQAAAKMSTNLENLDPKGLSEIGLQSSSEVLARFAAARSITVNTARRHLSAAAFLRQVLKPAEFDDIVKRQCPPFNDVEYLKKIHDIAPTKATDLLKAVLGRTISRTNLAKQYQELQERTPNQRHRIAIRRGSAIDFRSQIIEALTLSTHKLYPKKLPTKIIRMPRQLEEFEFALPDAVIEIHEDHDVRIDAIEIRMPNEGAKHEVWQILERIHLMSTFFTETWLFLPSPSTNEQREFIEKLINATKKLDIPSVGIVTCAITPNLSFEVTLRPFGRPDIDRRYLFPLGSERRKFLDGTPAERAKRIRRDASR